MEKWKGLVLSIPLSTLTYVLTAPFHESCHAVTCLLLGAEGVEIYWDHFYAWGIIARGWKGVAIGASGGLATAGVLFLVNKLIDHPVARSSIMPNVAVHLFDAVADPIKNTAFRGFLAPWMEWAVGLAILAIVYWVCLERYLHMNIVRIP